MSAMISSTQCLLRISSPNNSFRRVWRICSSAVSQIPFFALYAHIVFVWSENMFPLCSAMICSAHCLGLNLFTTTIFLLSFISCHGGFSSVIVVPPLAGIFVCARFRVLGSKVVRCFVLPIRPMW